MKCKCGGRIKKFQGKWWHYFYQETRIEGKKQISHSFYKISFGFANEKDCLNPFPVKNEKVSKRGEEK